MKTNVLMVLTLLLLASCSGESTEQAQSGDIFIGGSSGLTIGFEALGTQEDGVYTIYDTEDFYLDLRLQNKGEHTLESGDVRLDLLGVSQNDFSGISSWSQSTDASIEKISEFNPNGGEESVTFSPDGATYNREVIGYTELNFNVNYDYDYQTMLVISDVCFKGDITDDRVCEVTGDREFSVSGAPIQVTSVSQDTAGKGVIVLKISVQNAGTGEVTLVGEEFDRNRQQVSYSIESDKGFTCKSGGREGTARMINGVADVYCTLSDPLSESDLYVQGLTLNFDYAYKELISEKLRIKQSASD